MNVNLHCRMSRRTYLAASGSVFLGGCLLSDSNNDPPPGVSELNVRNERPKSLEATIIVYKDNEEVYNVTHELEGGNESWDTDHIQEPWLGERTFYEIVVDGSEIDEATFTTDDFLAFAGDTDEIECFGVTISIGPDYVDFPVSAKDDCSTDRPIYQ